MNLTNDILEQMAEMLAEWRFDSALSNPEDWPWSGHSPLAKEPWLKTAREAINSLGPEVIELIIRWHGYGRSKELIFHAVRAIYQAQDYGRKRKALIDSIKDPVMKKAAMRS